MTGFSTTLPTKASVSDYVLTLNQIRGVFASCVVLNKEQEVDEIHLVASTGRKPKQIVRDVETLLFVKHGTKIDYRKISMVQIPDEQLLRIPIARPEIRQVSEDVVGTRRRVRVEIKGASRISIGEADERLDNPSPFQTAARATLDALEKLLNGSIHVRLEHAESFRIGPRLIVVVIVTCTIEDKEETLVGACFVGSRPIESGARATMDALNRRIHNLAAQSPRQSERIEIDL